jgi:flagellar biogenesis protein FliO
MAESTTSMLAALLFLAVLAALAVGVVALRHRLPLGPARRGRRLQLVERLELGERRFLALVRCDDQEVLVGGGPQALTLLSSQPAPALPADERAAGPAFAELLGRLLGPRPRRAARPGSEP